MKFFGRTDLLLDLGALWGKNVASLVTCRGRRRIGKSTLIKRFAEESDARFIKIEGLRPERGLTNDDQLRSFAQQLALQTDDDGAVQSNWLGAFKRLLNQIRKGLAFENLIVNHYRELLPYLHMAEALVYSAAPYSKRGRRGEGFQIDLLIQARRSNCVVEIKRYSGEIKKGIIDEVDGKIKKLKRGSDSSMRAALVYCGRLAPSVVADGYFDAIVPVERLLGLSALSLLADGVEGVHQEVYVRS